MMNKSNKSQKRNTWLWVPSLYFAEGIPYIIVMTLSVIFYKRMGISNTDIALYTSWLYLPWVIKPLWSPVVDILKTKRYWIVIMQLMVGAGLAGVAFTIPVPGFFQYTLAFFWLLAFSSATHDIAADGFYMLGLSKHDQAFFVGIRSTFYRIAMLTGQGLLVILAGYFEARTGLPPVEIPVHATSTEQVMTFDPEQITVLTDTSALYFVTPESLTLGIKPVEKAKAADMLQSIEEWNIEHGFYKPEQTETQVAASAGWWHNKIAVPIGKYLKRVFNPDPDAGETAMAGNVGYVWFHLSQAPGENETVVFNFTQERGDKSIALAKSYRYEFTNQNWNVPAFAAIQLDAKLDEPAKAWFEGRSGNITLAWTIVFFSVAALFLVFALYHRFVLPRPAEDVPNRHENQNFVKEFFHTFAAFFRKRNIGVILTFLLVYRLGESQLVKLASPFLLDSQEKNGLGLTTGDLGLIYGTIGMIALSLGGIVGGIAASRKGLKYWIWWMAAAMNLPNLVYVFLAYSLPSSLVVVSASVAVEQFGYGFGFTAYMLYMIYVSEGKFKTAHFAITTGFMALGMMIPGMVSGWLQEIIGYQNFFIWVVLCTIPSFAIIPFLKIDNDFGKKTENEEEDSGIKENNS